MGSKQNVRNLRGKLAGLYIEKQMILSKEISEEDMDAKWKSLFQSKEEMIAVNNQLAEQVWNDDEKMDYGKAKDNAAKELGLNKEKPEPEAEEMRKYNERRTKERAKGLKK